jgi:hypothetical protein
MIDTIRIGHMIGPPLRKFSTKKFLSNALCSGVGLGLGVPAAAGEVVVVAGDIAALEGVIPGAGERPGTVAEALGAVVVVVVVVAGLIAVAGLVAGAGAVVVVVFAGAVAGLVAGAGAVPGGFGG